MRHSLRLLPDEPIEPTHTPAGIMIDAQREILRELRELQNAIPVAQFSRDDRLTALALSGSVSRRDMATACGLNKSRIDQIIATHSQLLQDEQNKLLLARVRRHLPTGLGAHRCFGRTAPDLVCGSQLRESRIYGPAARGRAEY